MNDSCSRCSTLFLGSPPSSASVQSNRAGKPGHHWIERGPVRTPSIGMFSANGTSATRYWTDPSKRMTSMVRGK